MSFQPAIPWQVALRQSLPPLRRLETILNNQTCRTIIFQRTATTPLTRCLSPGVHSTPERPPLCARESEKWKWKSRELAGLAARGKKTKNL